MTLAETYTNQLKHVAAANKRMLERIPADKLDWKPHAKSMSLGRLSMHIAELPMWVNRLLDADHFDFFAAPYKPNVPETHEQIMQEYETKLAAAVETLSKATDEQLQEHWQLRKGETVIFDIPRTSVLRNEQQHMVHHRGQLSVYLRLLDVPVPGIFGPSADER